ncbi:MAG: NUDIX hydrolase [Bacteroidota bacterium]
MKIGTFLILFNKNRTRVFLVFRSDFPVWGLTGGGLNRNEDPVDGAVRETVEETGFKVRKVRKLGDYCNSYGYKYVFEGRKIKGEFKPEYLGCKGKWSFVNRLPKNMTQISKNMVHDGLEVRDVLFKKTFREYDWRDLGLIIRNPKAAMRYVLNRLSDRINIC